MSTTTITNQHFFPSRKLPLTLNLNPLTTKAEYARQNAACFSEKSIFKFSTLIHREDSTTLSRDWLKTRVHVSKRFLSEKNPRVMLCNRYLPRNTYCPQQLSPPRSCSGSGRRNIQIKGSACAREFEEVRWSEMKGNQHHFSSGSPFFLQVASRAVETPCAWLACATQANNHTSVRNAIIGLMLRDLLLSLNLVSRQLNPRTTPRNRYHTINLFSPISFFCE